MNYEAFQNHIVTRLSGIINVDVVPMPATQAEFKRNVPPQKSARITVAYLGSDWGGVGSSFDIGVVEQEEKVRFNVEIQAKNLYDANGLYSVLDAVKALLLGFAPPACDKIHLKEGVLDTQADGLFTYVLVCEVKTYAVEAEDTTTHPLIKQITFNIP